MNPEQKKTTKKNKERPRDRLGSNAGLRRAICMRKVGIGGRDEE